MKRRFRLTRSNDIKRVRRDGKSYAHPLVVLVIRKTEEPSKRIAIITGRSIGGAVERNRVRRRLRAICDELHSNLATGFEAVLIARAPAKHSSFEELSKAIKSVYQRAGLIFKSDE